MRIFMFVACCGFSISLNNQSLDMPYDSTERTKFHQATHILFRSAPHAAFDAPPLDVPLSIRLMPLDPQARGKTFLLRNDSELPISIPISNDGETVYRACSKETILVSSLRWKYHSSPHMSFIDKSEYYGCAALPATIHILRKGDSLTYSHIPASGQDIPAYSLDEYKFSDGGKRVLITELYTVDSEMRGSP